MAVSQVAAGAAALAIDGGTPVRREPMPHDRGAAYIGEEEKRAVLEVLESQALFRYGDPRSRRTVERFEERFGALVGVRHAVGVASGTAALRVALAGLDIGPGDEVIVPAVTFIASPNAVIAQGAVPVFAEVDASFNLDPSALSERIGPRTRAIMPVHLMGTACRMDQIMDIARTHGLLVVEDCAQSCGASYLGRSVGAWGDAAAFSFQLSKNITSGEGGCFVTDRFEVFDRGNKYQDQGGQFTLGVGGTRERAGEPMIGENLRMNEIAGAILGVQLDRLPGIVERTRARRDQILRGWSGIAGIEPRPVPDPAGEVPVAAGFLLPTAELATRFAKALSAEGVPGRKVYGGRPVYANPGILHQRTISSTGRPFTDPLYLDRGPRIEYAMGMCPRSEDVLGRCVVTGISPLMTEADADDVVAAVAKVAGALL